MELLLIRHGETEANIKRLYVGSTDIPLCEQGIAAARGVAATGIYPTVKRLYVSPLQRARQTAAILFPNAEHCVVQDLREMDFGDFEGHSHDELVHETAYQKWLDSHCVLPCPHGESREKFGARVMGALTRLVDESLANNEQRLVVVAHGGVYMAVMSHCVLSERRYYEWWSPNCGGFKVDIEPDRWLSERMFAAWEQLALEERKS